MKCIMFIAAISMLSIPAFGQGSVYASTGESVYVSRAQSSAYITAPRARGMSSTVSFNDTGISNGFRSGDGTAFFNRTDFNAFNFTFPSVYMWGNGWLGRPLIDTGTIGRPLIDNGFRGRPGIDAGIEGSSPIPRSSLQKMDPRAARDSRFRGASTSIRAAGAARLSGASRGGGARFGGAAK